MIKKILYIMLISTFSNCDKTRTLKMELNKSQLISQGEWISNSDSLSGISIREDKIAFFKNMEFNSNDIYKYKIIDSVAYENDTKKIISTYLVTYDSKDTIKYKIENRKSSIISLKLKGNNIKTYKLKINK